LPLASQAVLVGPAGKTIGDDPAAKTYRQPWLPSGTPLSLSSGLRKRLNSQLFGAFSNVEKDDKLMRFLTARGN
jgi:hypothetical protein